VSSFRAWQEPTDDGAVEVIRILSIFPIERGFLITLRGHFTDKKDTFGHQEITFFSSFQQANEIAHTLLTHIRGKLQPLPEEFNDLE